MYFHGMLHLVITETLKHGLRCFDMCGMCLYTTECLKPRLRWAYALAVRGVYTC